MARSNAYTYDPATGKWNNTTVDSSDTKSAVAQTASTGSNSKDNLTSSTSDKDSSTGSTEKKYNTIEYNTLTGTLNYIATEDTIKLKAGDTVRLQGIGSYLSGDYYVQDVQRSISSSGYSHSATLLKTDFGSSLKIASSTTEAKKETAPVASTAPSTTNTNTRTYTVKKGDCLWAIAKKFYGNGNDYKKIFDANTKKIANPNLIYVGQVFVIP